MPDSLERIYRSVPHVQCKGLCSESCGPVDMSVEERLRVAAHGVDIPDPGDALTELLEHGDYTCPALVDDRCTVHRDRPLVCRLWGAVESMPCPHGCTVTPGLLMDDGAHALIARSLAVGGRRAD